MSSKHPFLDHELENPLWLKLRGHLESELASLRKQNDEVLEPALTAHLRGRIAQCKALLAIGQQPRPDIPPPSRNG